MNLGQDSFLAELPGGWTFDRFKDVAMLRNERTGEASEVEDYLELEDLESGTGCVLNRRNTMDVVSDVTRFKKGDVLFGKLRPYLEKYYVAEFDGKCTGEILAFRPERIESRFLFYCLASSWFIERCNLLAYGAKMPRVNWPTQLAQFNLPLPPLPEQQRIAAYLDASCAAIDAAVAAKRRQLETLDALRKSIIHSFFSNQSDASNERVKDVAARITSGVTPEGAKIVTPADLLPHIRHYADRKQEHFLCASINGANEILNIRVVSIGLIDRSPVHPREVFADALSDRASAVIVAHNHPSGGVEPSQSDINITAQLKAAGEIVGIELLDHIIFNRTGYFSFLEAGRL